MTLEGVIVNTADPDNPLASIAVDGVPGSLKMEVHKLDRGALGVSEPVDSTHGLYVEIIKGVIDNVILASGARTTTQTGSDITNVGHKSAVLTVSCTASSAGSITPSIQGKDANGIYYTMWTARTPITTSGVYAYQFAAGATDGSFTETVSISISSLTLRVVLTANNGNSITYSSALALGLCWASR